MRLSGSNNQGEGFVEFYDDVQSRWFGICADQRTDHMVDSICRQAGWPGGYQGSNILRNLDFQAKYSFRNILL